MKLAVDAPVGVFDSGIGGLSILRALQELLPAESFVYYADSAHAPYGERGTDYVTQRSLAITQHLRDRHHIKALVVACNTATSVAIQTLRATHADLPIVGVEPALKPAVAFSKTRHIGVVATRATISSPKFQALLASLGEQAKFSITACDGLAHAIEAQENSKTEALIALYTSATGRFGHEISDIDTLVLGCTHYPLEHDTFKRAVGQSIRLIEPGEAVAKQLAAVLSTQHLLRDVRDGRNHPAGCMWESSSENSDVLQQAVQRWLPPRCWQQTPLR